MTKVHFAAIAGAVISLATTACAHAETLQFKLQGGVFTNGAATFSLSNQPRPTQYNNFGFAINNVRISYDGDTTLYNLGFSDASPDSSFFAYARAGDGDYALGSPLYTGQNSAPQFKTGYFSLTDFQTETPLSVDISAVPEPSTWALVILGIGGIGFAFRQAKRNRGSHFEDSVTP